ncbi:MAG: class I SAM-dependent rRNA methyltransferase [Bacteroidales bacterium]|nr:class I SAM-dependent rRNA methyltransferase [Bacteroidales bacterium]
MKRPRLIIARGKEKAILRRHPWIFSGAVLRKEGNPDEGDLIDVFSSDGSWMAVGHYQNDSIICKVLSFDSPEFDVKNIRARLISAINYRRRFGFFDTNNQSSDVFRLVNGEGDNLPGLICDWYAGTLVMQAHSVGMHKMFQVIVEQFVDLLQPMGLLSIYDKSSATLPGGCENGFLWGEEQEEREVCENGCRLNINFAEGQKTGFFVDQRENRQLVGSLARGRRVLNCFGYTGGFSLAALRGGAEYVETVDISRRAIDLCNRNVELNFGADAHHKGVVADVLKYLDSPFENPFDLIILDPPAFAKNHRSLQQGLKGYRSINQRAMEKIADGGLLFTFSCSQAVSPDEFQTMLFSAAMAAHKSVRIVRHLPHAVDHPVSIYHPEGLYLKGLLVEVSGCL